MLVPQLAEYVFVGQSTIGISLFKLEKPYADPHVRCCERCDAKTSAYSIFCLRQFTAQAFSNTDHINRLNSGHNQKRDCQNQKAGLKWHLFSVMGLLQVLQYRLSGQGIRSGRKQSTLICRVQDALVKAPPVLNTRTPPLSHLPQLHYFLPAVHLQHIASSSRHSCASDHPHLPAA